MIRHLVSLPILFAARIVAAQPGLEDPPPLPAPPVEPPYVEAVFVHGGALVTVDHFLNAAWFADGGIRLGDLPLAVHASIATGGSLDADNGGDFWRSTFGVEARTARSGGYGFFNFDLGYQHQTWGDRADIELGEYEVHRGGLVIGRVGYDGGGDHVRVRATFELYSYHREFVDRMTEWQRGGGITLSLGYRK